MTHVYVIQAEGGPVRIGMTVDVRVRLQSLRTNSPLPLELVHVEEIEDPRRAAAIERSAHVLLADARSHGSWFRVSAETAVAAIRLAIEDPHSLTRWSEQRALKGDALRLVREARGWSVESLAQEVGMSVDFVLCAENGGGYDVDRGRMRAALEAAGIEFIPENGGGPGVRLRKA